jgi:hypothetical protein
LIQLIVLLLELSVYRGSAPSFFKREPDLD